MLQPKKENAKSFEDLTPKEIENAAFGDATFYDPMAFGSTTEELYEGDDRDVILQEAVRGSMEEGFRDREGNWQDASQLNLAFRHDESGDDAFGNNPARLMPGSSTTADGTEKHELARVVGVQDYLNDTLAEKLIKQMGGEQAAKNALEKNFGWVPGKDQLVNALFKQTGFVPAWDPEKRKFVLQETGLDPESLRKVGGRVMAAAGTPDRNKTWLGSMFETFAQEAMNTPTLLVNFLAMGSAFGEGAKNLIKSKPDLTPGALFKSIDEEGSLSGGLKKWIHSDQFNADKDNFIDHLSDALNRGNDLNRIPEYFHEGRGTFEDPNNMFSALGQGLSSLVQFGGVGGAVRKGTGWAFKGLAGNMAKKALDKTGKAYTAGQLAAKTAQYHAKYANLFGNAVGGMTINSGYIFKEADQMGLETADAAALSMGVGMISTAIEMSIGTNELNNWLIGSKGLGTKEMINAIAKETGGDLSASAVQRAVNNRLWLNRTVDALKNKAIGWGANNKVIGKAVQGAYLSGKVGTAGKLANRFLVKPAKIGLEEGVEEFLQSVNESTGKFLYNQFVADEGSTIGEGRFETSRFLDEKTFKQAFEEFAIGAMVGGMTGGIMASRPILNRDIKSLVAQGYANDVLSVMQSMKDQGVYNEEQYAFYTNYVKEFDTLWREHGDDIAQATADLPIHDQKVRMAHAAHTLDMLKDQQNKLDAARQGLASAQTDKERDELEVQIQMAEAMMYALDQQLKSFKDKKKANYSAEVRMYETDTNFRKALLLSEQQKVKQSIEDLQEQKKEHKQKSEPWKALHDRQLELKELYKLYTDKRSALNHRLKMFSRASWRQAFDADVEKGKRSYSNMDYSHDMEYAMTSSTMRVVMNGESISDLRRKGYQVYTLPSTKVTVTDAPFTEPATEPEQPAPKETPTEEPPTPTKEEAEETPTKEPEQPSNPQPEKETAEEPEETPEKESEEAPLEQVVEWWNNLKKNIKSREREFKEDARYKQIEQAIKDGTLKRVPQDDGTFKWNDFELVTDQETDEDTDETPSTPTVIKRVYDKETGEPIDVIQEYSSKGSTYYVYQDEVGNAVTTLSSQYSAYPGQFTDSKRWETPIINLWSTLYRHQRRPDYDEKSIEEAMQSPDFYENLRYELVRFAQGPKRIWARTSGAGITTEVDEVDVVIYYKDTYIGQLQNTRKYGIANNAVDYDTVDFRNMPYEEFLEKFRWHNGLPVTPESYSEFQRQYGLLKDLKARANSILTSTGEDSVILDDISDLIPLEITAQFQTRPGQVAGQKTILYDLQDTNARNSQGQFVVYDTHKRRYLTMDENGQTILGPLTDDKLPAKEGSRYKALVERGPVQRWIDLTPAMINKQGDMKGVMAALRDIANKIYALSSTLQIDSEQVEELQNRLDNIFIVLNSTQEDYVKYPDRYVKFNVTRSKKTGGFGITLRKYSTIDKDKSGFRMWLNEGHFKSEAALYTALTHFTGVNIDHTNFRTGISDNLKAAPGNEELFSIFLDKDPLGPLTMKLNLDKLHLSKIARPVTKPVTKQVTEQQTYNSLEEIMNDDSLSDEQKQALMVQFFDNQEAATDDDLKFERVPTLPAYNSKYIVNWIAAQVSQANSGSKTGKEKRAEILGFLDQWLEGLTPASLAQAGLGEDFKRKMVMAAKEISALRDVPENRLNRDLVVREVRSKFTDLIREVENEDEFESEDMNDFNKDMTMKGIKISAAVKEFIAYTLYDGIDHYGRSTKTLVHYGQVYDKILQNLANLKDREKQYDRLAILAETDKQLAAIRYKLDSLGKNSALYKAFFNNFTSMRIGYAQAVIGTNSTGVYDALTLNPEDMLLGRWESIVTSRMNNMKVEDREKLARKLELFQMIMDNGSSLQIVQALNEMEDGTINGDEKYGIEFGFIRAMNEMGIDLPIDYVRGVFGDSMIRETFDEREFLSGDSLVYIIDSIRNWDTQGKHFFSDKVKSGNGILMRRIAQNAVPFSPDAYAKTFKDAENKTRYSFVQPNYLLEEAIALMNSAENNQTDSAPFNYLLHKARQEGDQMFKKMHIRYVGDVRVEESFETPEGKKVKYTRARASFKNLTPTQFLNVRFALFNDPMLRSEGNEFKAIYQPFVIAEKRSSYGVELPIDTQLAAQGRATQKAVDTVFDTLFMGEVNRIVSIMRDPSLKLKYNTKTPFAFLTVFNGNQEILDAIEKVASSGKEVTDSSNVTFLKQVATRHIGGMLNEVIDETLALVDSFSSHTEKIVIPSEVLEYYNEGVKDATYQQKLRNYIGVFAINDLLTRASFSELIQGDAAITKNEIDRVKRAAGMNAAGAPVIGRDIRVAYKTDAAEVVEADVVNRQEGTYESAADDAVVYVTPQYRYEMWDYMGRVAPGDRVAWEKMIAGEDLDPEDVKKLDLISAKTVHYTPEIYNKKSDVVLYRGMTSMKDADGNWVAQPHRERLHNMLEWMLKNQVDQLVTWNATKGIKNEAIEHEFFGENFTLDGPVPMRDNQGNTSTRESWDDYFEATKLRGEHERLQVENNSKSAKGIHEMRHPTQQIELIGSELYSVEGNNVAPLLDEFNELRATLMEHNVDIALKYLMRTDENGNLDIGDFITKARQTLQTAQEREEVIRYVQDENGKFKYNLNLPHLQQALRKILVSHFNKGALIDYTPGVKVTLVPSPGFQVVTDLDGNLQDPVDVADNPQKYADKTKYKTRDLAVHDVGEDGQTKLAEIMLTRRSMRLMGLKAGDTIPAEALEVFGSRIPAQWYHSLIGAKVVGFLPDVMGDVAVLPKEMPLIAGEDFDVDARYLMVKSGYWEYDRKNNTKEWKLFGSAESVGAKWGEYERYYTEQKMIRHAAKQMLAVNPEYQLVLGQIQEFKEDKMEALREQRAKILGEKKQETQNRNELFAMLVSGEIADNFEQELRESGASLTEEQMDAMVEEQRQRAIKQIGESKKLTKQMQEYVDSLFDDLKALYQQKTNLEKIATKAAMKKYGLIDSFNEFKQALKEGKNPVIQPALQNRMIEVYLEMFTHPSIQDRLKVPADVGALKKEAKFINGLWDNLDENGEVIESRSMLISPVGSFNAWYNNVAGASNIAIVASTNIFTAFATKNSLELSMPIKIDGKSYDTFGVTMEDSLDENNQLMEETEFKFDTNSGLITAMTDNAKERLANLINMKQQFVGLATMAAGLGIGKRRIMLMFNQPVFRLTELTYKSQIAKGDLLNAIMDIDAELKLAYESLYPSGDFEGGLDEFLKRLLEGPLTSQDMIDGARLNKVLPDGRTVFSQTENLTEERLQGLATQRKVLLQVWSLLGLGTEARAAMDLINIKKGFATTDGPLKVAASWASLIEINTNPEKIPALLNLLPSLQADKAIMKSLELSRKISEAWSRHLLDLTPNYRMYRNSVEGMVAPDQKMDFANYLVGQAFREAIDKGKPGRLLSYTHLLYNGMDNKHSLVKEFKDLLGKNPEFAQTQFAKQVIGKWAGTRGNSSNMDMLMIDSFSPLPEDVAGEAIESFDEIFRSSDPEVKRFGQHALLYLILKDGFQFKRGSFVNLVSPEMITNTFRILDELQADMYQGEEKISALGNVEFAKLRNNYLDLAAVANRDVFRRRTVDELKEVGEWSATPKGATAVIAGSGAKAEGIYGKMGKKGFKAFRYIRVGDAMWRSTRSRIEVDDKDNKTLVLEFTRIKQRPTKQSFMHYKDVAEYMEWSDKILESKKPPQPAGIPAPTMELDQLPEVEPSQKVVPEPPTVTKPVTPTVTAPEGSLAEIVSSLNDKGELKLESVLGAIAPDSEYKRLAALVDSKGIQMELVWDDGNFVGAFSKSRGKILVNVQMLSEIENRGYDATRFEKTLVHEMLHAFVENLPKVKHENLIKDLKKWIADLSKHADFMKGEVAQIWREIQSDPTEAITYAFTNDKFAKFLDSIEAPLQVGKTKTSFWRRLKEIILSRLPKSAFFSKLDELSNIMDMVLDSDGEWTGMEMTNAQVKNESVLGDLFPESDMDSDVKYEIIQKTFSVMERNLESVTKGEKTVAHRQMKDANTYKEGDVVELVSRGKGTGKYIRIKAVHAFEKFPSLPKDRMDEMARKMGDYKSFDDMMAKNQYLDPKSSASKGYPAFRKFLLGEVPGILIEFEPTIRSPRMVIDEALQSNPSLDPYQKMITDVETRLKEQLESLQGTDIQDSAFRINRIKRLKGMLERLTETQDLLEVANGVQEEFESYTATLDDLIEKYKEESDSRGFIDKMFRFLMLYNSYDFLDKLVMNQKLLMENSENERKPDLWREIERAASLRTEMKGQVLAAVKSAVAKELAPFKGEKGYRAVTKEIEQLADKHEQKLARMKEKGMSKEAIEKAEAKFDKYITKLGVVLQDSAYSDENIEALLGFTSRDISMQEQWLSAKSQSSDAILALSTLMVKRAFEDGRKRTINDANDIQTVYDKFKSEFGGKYSLKKMYQELIEEVTLSNGDKRLAFVGRFDEERFAQDMVKAVNQYDRDAKLKEYSNELASLKLLGKKATKKQYKRMRRLEYVLKNPSELKALIKADFFAANTKKKSDQELAQIIARQQRVLGNSDDWIEWASKRMSGGAIIRWSQGFISDEQIAELKASKNFEAEERFFNGMFTDLADKYLNERWLKLYNADGTPKNAKGELHQILTEKYLEAQKRVYAHKRQDLILPGIYKDPTDRFVEGQAPLDALKSIGQELKERFTGDTIAEETEYGSADPYGGFAHTIPTYFYNNLAPEDTNIDVVKSVLKYISMANDHFARNEVMQTSLFVGEYLSERSVGEQTTNFLPLLNPVARRLGLKVQQQKQGAESNSYQAWMKFVEMQIFGRSKKEVKWRNIRVDMVVNAMMAHASLSAFGLHADPLARIFMGAAANMNQIIGQQVIETIGEMGVKDGTKVLAKGQQLATQYGADIWIKDFGKSGNKSMIGQWIDHYDVMQGEYTGRLGERISGSKARKLATMDTLFVHRHFTEAEPQIAFALGHAYYTQVPMADGSTTNLIDAYEVGEDGKLRLREGVLWSKADEFKFMNRLHGINKYLNGVYNRFDKSAAEQYVVGQMALFFRKYLYPGLRRRYARERIDFEMDSFERGYASSFWKALYRDIFTYKSDLVSVLKGDGFTQKEKIEAIKVGVSMSIYLAFASMAAILRAMVEDDEDPIIYNYLLYNAARMRSETATFWNPMEFMRILRSPTILTSYLERQVKFLVQLGDPAAEYERAYGPYEKGDSKLYARFIKAVLGQTHYSTHPETAVRNFENLIK